MKKYIKLKKHDKMMAVSAAEINRLRTVVFKLHQTISEQKLEMRRAVADARHGTLTQYVQEVNEKVRNADALATDDQGTS